MSAMLNTLKIASLSDGAITGANPIGDQYIDNTLGFGACPCMPDLIISCTYERYVHSS